jgi:hypothetical protein
VEAATLEVEGRRRSMVQGWRRFVCATAASPSVSVWLRRHGDQFKDKGRSRLLPWRQSGSLRIGQATDQARRSEDGRTNVADGAAGPPRSVSNWEDDGGAIDRRCADSNPGKVEGLPSVIAPQTPCASCPCRRSAASLR